jgi:hypothetical protein
MDDKEKVGAFVPGSTAAAKVAEDGAGKTAAPVAAQGDAPTLQAGEAPQAAVRANSRATVQDELAKVLQTDETKEELAAGLDPDALRINIREDVERAYALSMNPGVNRILERVMARMDKLNQPQS